LSGVVTDVGMSVVILYFACCASTIVVEAKKADKNTVLASGMKVLSFIIIIMSK
jgi:hypothetical protein